MNHAHFRQLSRSPTISLVLWYVYGRGAGGGVGGGAVRAAAVGADVSFLNHSGAKETDVSHQDRVQLGARMSCFCLCFATVTLICQQPATSP